jgi:hypothetical protein
MSCNTTLPAATRTQTAHHREQRVDRGRDKERRIREVDQPAALLLGMGKGPQLAVKTRH